MMRNPTTPAVLAFTVVLLVILPLWRSGGDLVGTANYVLQSFSLIAIFAVICIGLNIQLGYAGIDNFGIAAFLMLSSYCAAIVVLPLSSSEYVAYIGGFRDYFPDIPFLMTREWLPFVFAILFAAFFSSLLAILLAFVTPRLQQDYLAIATIGVAELLRAIALEEQGLVNGDRGLIGIPAPFSGAVTPAQHLWIFSIIVATVLLLVYVAAQASVRSPWGRMLRAVREDDIAVTAIGRSVFRFRLQSFVLGAIFMGIGGALFAFYRRGLSPQDFEPLQGTFLFWVMLIVGGIGNNRGAILGAAIVWALWISTLQLANFPLPEELGSRIPYLRYVLLGVLFVAMLLLKPKGLIPEEQQVSKWIRRRPVAASNEVAATKKTKLEGSVS